MTLPSGKVAFLFKDGRRSRLEAALDGHSPSEFFYGYCQLYRRYADLDLIEESDLGFLVRNNLFDNVLAYFSQALLGLHILVVLRFCSKNTRERLNAFDTVVTTTNLQTVCMGAASRLGIIRCRIVGIGMGIIPRFYGKFRRSVVLWALRNIALLLLSRSEELALKNNTSANGRISYLPFGVDHLFWTPGEHSEHDDYVLSIGKDENRDYDTLIAAWRPDFPKLKIMTSLPVKSDADNVEVIHSDWFSQVFSDEELRELIRKARFVVIPIKQTIQPSGQSACLQAMSCGKAVILSDIEGIWDRENMVDGRNCILVPPGSAPLMSEAVATALSDSASLSAIGERARASVEAHFNINIMADKVQQAIGNTMQESNRIPGLAPGEPS